MAAKTLKDYICEVAFPVGTVYMTRQDITEAQVGQLKGGTWTQLTDCYLVGAGSVTDTYNVTMSFSPTLTKAGSNTVLAIPPHTHATSSNGAHGHSTKYVNMSKQNNGYDVGREDGGMYQAVVLTNGSAHTHTVSANASAGNNNRPYTYHLKMFYKTAL